VAKVPIPCKVVEVMRLIVKARQRHKEQKGNRQDVAESRDDSLRISILSAEKYN